MVHQFWPVGQAAKTKASHALNVGSIPARVTMSSTYVELKYSSLAQLVEHAAVNRRVVGSSPTGGAKAYSLFCKLFCFVSRFFPLKLPGYESAILFIALE